jgi:hypothetical protein
MRNMALISFCCWEVKVYLRLPYIHELWWCMPVISALRRLRQEDYKFEDSPCCIARASLKNQNKYIKRILYG